MYSQKKWYNQILKNRKHTLQKGKPSESLGRKATGLKMEKMAAGLPKNKQLKYSFTCSLIVFVQYEFGLILMAVLSTV